MFFKCYYVSFFTLVIEYFSKARIKNFENVTRVFKWHRLEWRILWGIVISWPCSKSKDKCIIRLFTSSKTWRRKDCSTKCIYCSNRSGCWITNIILRAQLFSPRFLIGDLKFILWADKTQLNEWSTNGPWCSSCNWRNYPSWTEIKNLLLPGQQPSHRHYLTARVFKQKSIRFINLVTKNHTYKKTHCWMYSIEWKKIYGHVFHMSISRFGWFKKRRRFKII